MVINVNIIEVNIVPRILRRYYEKIKLNKRFRRVVKGEKDGYTKKYFERGSAYIL